MFLNSVALFSLRLYFITPTEAIHLPLVGVRTMSVSLEHALALDDILHHSLAVQSAVQSSDARGDCSRLWLAGCSSFLA